MKFDSISSAFNASFDGHEFYISAVLHHPEGFDFPLSLSSGVILALADMLHDSQCYVIETAVKPGSVSMDLQQSPTRGEITFS